MKCSVIMPTYNRVHMIGRTIDSVLAQRGVDSIEIIVVDDGSTDGTADLIREQYKAILLDDSPADTPKSATSPPSTLNLQPSTSPPSTYLRLIHQANSGAPAARNRGMREATGDYIALLDSDDELTPDSLVVRGRALDANPDVDLVCGNFVHCVDGKQVGPDDYERLDLLRITKNRQGRAGAVIIDDFFDAQLRRPIALTSALCLRRSVLTPADLFDESLPIGQDWDFCLRFSRKHTVAIAMTVTARRHVHETNLVKTERKEDGMIILDRTVLAYPDLTVEQRTFMLDRLADDLYEYSYAALRHAGARRKALKALSESMRMRITLPKLKLLAACCLPHKLLRRQPDPE